MERKKAQEDINSLQNKLLNDKIKVEGIKRKKRRMRLKSKGNNDVVIERFTAQSSKQAKYAKTTVKKADARSQDARQITSPGMGGNHGMGATSDTHNTSAVNTSQAT